MHRVTRKHLQVKKKYCAQYIISNYLYCARYNFKNKTIAVNNTAKPHIISGSGGGFNCIPAGVQIHISEASASGKTSAVMLRQSSLIVIGEIGGMILIQFPQ